MKILALDLGKFNTMCGYFDTATRKHRFIGDRDLTRFGDDYRATSTRLIISSASSAPNVTTSL
jgi:hypothetical protein